MTEVRGADVSAADVNALDDFASTLPEDSELRGLLVRIFTTVRSGAAVTVFESDAELTPTQAASRLRMSRTHLYKLLDAGDIACKNVGRDRRIPVAELVRYQAGRDRDRHELAERLASTDRTEAGAIDELLAGL